MSTEHNLWQEICTTTDISSYYLNKIIDERRAKALAVVDQIDWEIKPVECDDYGDDYYKWHVEFFLDGAYVWDDWFHNEPDDTQIYNTLLESIKEGSLADRLAQKGR